MLLNDGNVIKQFQNSIFYKSRENHVSPKLRQSDISNYRVASLLIKKNNKYQRERKGTMGILHWSPKFYNNVFLLVDLKTLGTLVNFDKLVY